MTTILRLDEMEARFDDVLEVFRKGGVVLYPTDTLYGLGVIARNRAAVEKVCAIKQSGPQKMISIIVPDVAAARQYVHVPPNAYRLMEQYLPGALTLVLPAKDKQLAKSRGNEKEIGVRIPAQPEVLEIVRALGEPITTTSANLSGCVPGTSVDEILETLDSIDLAIDGGFRANGPSTIVSCDDVECKILRQGVLSVQL